MKSKKPEQKKPSELRQRAEEKLKSQITLPKAMSDKETRQLIHELQVHQIELEMQNDELRKSQAELEESRSKYSDLYDFAPVGYFTFDKDGLTLEANLTAAKELGVERSLLINKPFRAYIVKEDREIFDSHLWKVFKSDDRQTCEIRLKRKKGTEIYAQLESIAVLDSGGVNVCRTSCIDITSRKRTDTELLAALADLGKRHAEISGLLEGSQAVARYHDFKGAAESLFNSCKKLIGATSGYVALVSKDGMENEVLFLDSGGLPCAVDETLPMPIRGLRGEVFRNAKTIYDNDFPKSEWMQFIPEGHTAISSVLFAPMVVEGKVLGLLGLANKPGGFTANDAHMATAFAHLASIALVQKRTEEEVRRSEEYFRLLTENALDIITILEADWTIRYASPSLEQVLQYKRESLIGTHFFEFIHPDDLPDVMKTFNQLIKDPGFILFLQARCRHKDGSWRILEIMANNLIDNPAVNGIVVNCRDITGRKRAEEELKRSNEDLKQFASVASHDLQEPLRGIESFIKLLEKRYKGKLDEKADEYIDYVVDDVKRMQLLIKDLLEYSRVSATDKVFSPANCSVVLEQTLNNLRSAIEESGAEVTYDLLPVVMGDAAQLTRLYQNLIGNAVKFRSLEPLKIHIAVKRERNEWLFSIRDTGIGIDPKQAERIFVIFQRLHSRHEYPGTGIGLSICKRIVERHGGRIWLESEPEKGATFYFTIPAIQANPADLIGEEEP
ncbi:MAG: PAS domain S-box protein [Thermodesulfovibrionales bacterium]